MIFHAETEAAMGTAGHAASTQLPPRAFNVRQSPPLKPHRRTSLLPRLPNLAAATTNLADAARSTHRRKHLAMAHNVEVGGSSGGGGLRSIAATHIRRGRCPVLAADPRAAVV